MIQNLIALDAILLSIDTTKQENAYAKQNIGI